MVQFVAIGALTIDRVTASNGEEKEVLGYCCCSSFEACAEAVDVLINL